MPTANSQRAPGSQRAAADPDGENKPSPACLTIAGSDPSGGAGMQADLKTFAAMGVYGASALTVATDCQTQGGVDEVHALPPAFVRRQIDRVCASLAPAAVKTGMLYDEDIIRAVAEAARAHGFGEAGGGKRGSGGSGEGAPLENIPFVVDPVMTTRQGERLLSGGAEAALAEELLPLATIITPSLPEAERLSGRKVRTRKAMRKAAEALLGLGPRAVVVTGGHLEDRGNGEEAADLLFDAGGKAWLEAERVPRATRGAGDTFSAALAAGLARGQGHSAPSSPHHGDSVRAAASRAKAFVTGAIRHAPERGPGVRPLWHEWFGTVPFEGGDAPAAARPTS